MEVVILAAGKGTRMYSAQPKVLHELAGKPMLSFVLDAVQTLRADRVHVVIGFGADQIKSRFAASTEPLINWVQQDQQHGTGHAVQQAIPNIDCDSPENQVLVLFGDVPLISANTLNRLLERTDSNAVALLTVISPDPTGLGRIIRDEAGLVTAIVEHRDATQEQREIDETNTGIMAIPAQRLRGWLENLRNQNDQGEYYLTDIIAMAVSDGCHIHAVRATDPNEVLGVNNKVQLAYLERYIQNSRAEALMASGTTFRDPSRVDIRGELVCGQDVQIDINVIFEGQVTLGEGVSIGANCIIRQSRIGNGTQILAGTQLEGAEIGEAASIGPMARIRPGTVLHNKVKIGNFVEVKNSVFGEESKANHLAYIGDAQIGSGCNIGAGTIFCNYDGANKHRTVLGNNVFIGSNSTLVAPLNLADNVFVAAGSTITDAVPEQNLAIARGRQTNISGWTRPVKKAPLD